MRWSRCLKLTVPLVLLTSILPATGLIHPRRAEPADIIALQDEISDFQIPIYKTSKDVPALNVLPHHRRKRSITRRNPTSHPHTQTINATEDATYWVPVKIGDQDFKLLLDTGSSDTWVVTKPWYRCLGYSIFEPDTIVENPPSYCAFGPGFDTRTSDTFQIVNENDTSFLTRYFDDSVVSGYLGEDIVDVSGVVVTQVIGIANWTLEWQGDGETSGILGLGYPGTIPSEPGHTPFDWVQQDQLGTHKMPFDCHEVYPSFVENLATYNYKSIFSIALNRSQTMTPGNWTDTVFTPEGGLLTLGGIPSLEGLGLPFARAKMNPHINEDNACASDFNQIGYGIEIDGVADGQEAFVTERYPAKVDTGSPIIAFPRKLAKKVYNRIYPDAKDYPEPWELWTVPCNETFPEFGFVIDGVVITMQRPSVITAYDHDATGETGKLMCSTMFITHDAGSDFIILGAPFLQEVLAIYDVEHKEMRFGKRFGN
ncbi:hypothetical protein TWF696_004309 [Orbilia brochopaga]|uniref:Peptidase A1 domain-containing protein n=1 Tax=Orbilia brochopaga TaxID=3140254 RepID=A0AAV9V5R2_9PEZI